MSGYEDLFPTAAGQMGYFTLEQAHSAGVSSRMVLHHAKQGRFVRASRGVYRFRDFPDSPTDFPVAWLAVSRLAAGKAAISHGSALYLHDLSELLPRVIDVLVDRSERGVTAPRRPPIRLRTTVHWPSGQELQVRGGAVVTSPIRTLVDCAVSDVERDQLVEAYCEAEARGWLTDDLLLARAAARGPRWLAGTRALIADALQACRQ
jgi:predicted transcriptional regulator of viral defense system